MAHTSALVKKLSYEAVAWFMARKFPFGNLSHRLRWESRKAFILPCYRETCGHVATRDGPESSKGLSAPFPLSLVWRVASQVPQIILQIPRDSKGLLNHQTPRTFSQFQLCLAPCSPPCIVENSCNPCALSN